MLLLAVCQKQLPVGYPIGCAKVHHSILDAYRQDFGTYAKEFQIKYVDVIFDSIPKQLGKRFKYSVIEGDYRKRELAPCLDLLSTAGVIQRIYHTAGNGIPLGAEVNLNYFKTILLDVGLTQAALGLSPRSLLLYPIEELINRGSIIESFIGQELLCYSMPIKKTYLYYWQRKTSPAEVDYLAQQNQHIIPLEVKNGKGTALASMHSFLESHKNTPYGIRISTHNYSEHSKIRSYPLYALAKALDASEVTKKLLD